MRHVFSIKNQIVINIAKSRCVALREISNMYSNICWTSEYLIVTATSWILDMVELYMITLYFSVLNCRIIKRLKIKRRAVISKITTILNSKSLRILLR